MNLSGYRKSLTGKMALRSDLHRRLKEKNESLKFHVKQKENAEKALFIIQEVSKKTQEQLEYRISELVTLALSAVFDDPYKFRMIYETKRNKTEAFLWLEKEGHLVNPMSASGGGVIDVCSFALRIALWSIASNKTTNVMVLDEPFKHLSIDLQGKAGAMLKEISEKLGLQIIMVSHLDELIDGADKVFKVSQKNKISKVEEL